MSDNDVPRTELDMQEELTNLLLGAEEEGFEVWEVASVNSFSEAGVMTNNKGLVVTLRNGAEFQITIVQSDLADDANDDEPDDAEDHGPGCDGPLNCTCQPTHDEVVAARFEDSGSFGADAPWRCGGGHDHRTEEERDDCEYAAASR